MYRKILIFSAATLLRRIYKKTKRIQIVIMTPPIQMPRVPERIIIKNIKGIQSTASLPRVNPVRSLARAFGASPSDLGEATSNGVKSISRILVARPSGLTRVQAKNAGRPSSKNIGNEWESGKRENTRSESWSPK